MDAQPAKEPSLNKPDEQLKKVESFPSLELFDEIMNKPRGKADYFNAIISERFISDGSATLRDASSQQVDKIISRDVESYQNFWLVQDLPGVKDDYAKFITASPEAAPNNNELLFHTINQFMKQQWQRVLVSPKYPKMDSMDLHTAQIQLAIESVTLLSAKNNPELAQHTHNQLRDIDAMIKLLQLSIDGALHNQPGLITLPHPQIGRDTRPADFLIFEPKPDNSFNKNEVKTSDIIDANQTPGQGAVDLLTDVRINSISRRPEFQERAKFHKFVIAHKNARIYQQQIASESDSDTL